MGVFACVYVLIPMKMMFSVFTLCSLISAISKVRLPHMMLSGFLSQRKKIAHNYTFFGCVHVYIYVESQYLLRSYNEVNEKSKLMH